MIWQTEGIRYNPKAVQQIAFVGQLKKKLDNNGNATDAGND